MLVSTVVLMAGIHTPMTFLWAERVSRESQRLCQESSDNVILTDKFCLSNCIIVLIETFLFKHTEYEITYLHVFQMLIYLHTCTIKNVSTKKQF